MSTSELSNALNPYITQERPRQQVADYQTSLHQVAPNPQHYVPHRSELELAISVPQPLPPPQPNLGSPPTAKPRGPSSQEGFNPLQVFRLVATTKEAQEIERKRRLAWEQEQEAKFAQRQAETERSILEMRQEIQALRAMLSRQMQGCNLSQQQQQLSQTPHLAPPQPESSMAGMFATHYNMLPALQEQNMPQHPSTPNPISIGQSHSPTHHVLVQGPSNESYLPYPHSTAVGPSLRHLAQQHVQYPPRMAQLRAMSPRQPQPQQVHQTGCEDQQLQNRQLTSLQPEMMGQPAAQSVTPSPSPHLSVSQPPTDSSSTRRKRKTSEISSDGDVDSDDSDAGPAQRIRRFSHHDKRCLTIQHAMRLHFLRCMDLETDKELPNSHAEGIALDDSQPVRFVWDKTTKQSVHNARMKARIIADLKAKRAFYKHVPEKDFGKKALDATFEQCFVTFRQKYKAQRDAAVAMNLKQKEDQKARRARHLSRRKIKLSNRAESRQKLLAFEHVIFDGALQLECMSSEESDEDHAGIPGTSKSGPILRTRGYAWRSSRLIRFFCILDNEERSDKMTKPKRGAGKKGRCIGPPKEGLHLPPKGVATWMLSRKWLSSVQAEQPDLPDMLSKLVLDPPGFDWDHFDVLGLDSDAEGQEHNGCDIRRHEMQNVHMQQLDMMQMGRTQYSSTSSLNYALV